MLEKYWKNNDLKGAWNCIDLLRKNSQFASSSLMEKVVVHGVMDIVQII